MKECFVTPHLRVFTFDTADNGINTSRHVFVAFFRHTDWPGHVCVATVTPFSDVMGGCYLDWIETTTPHRRSGLARELWDGIEKHLEQPLAAEGATPEGDAFCEHMYARKQ